MDAEEPQGGSDQAANEEEGQAADLPCGQVGKPARSDQGADGEAGEKDEDRNEDRDILPCESDG
jgi:hypothetical protein